MVETINPVVYGKRVFESTIIAHATGLVLGAAATGLLIGYVGLRFAHSAVSIAALVLLTAWCSLAEMGLLGMPQLQSHWQVPREWRRLAPWKTGLLYGLGLGPGVTTRISTRAFYVVILGTALTGSLTESATIFISYAIGRWLVVWLIASPTARDLQEIHERVRAFLLWRPLMSVMMGLILAFCAGTFLSLLTR